MSSRKKITPEEASLLAIAVSSMHNPSSKSIFLKKTNNPWIIEILEDLFGECKMGATKGLIQWHQACLTVHAPPKRCKC